VASARLDLGAGLTVLSGETGAGKSILVDALGLALGSRASADMVRTGADAATVEAVFESTPGANAFLAAHALPGDDDEVVIRREVSAGGKGRASVNGAIVPVAVLRELAPSLAVIHGQHEPQGLLDPATHLRVLDSQAGLERDTRRVGELFQAYRDVAERLEAVRRDRRETERRRDTLEFQAGEIEAARIRPGEGADLQREKRLLGNAERLAALSSEAYALLYEDESSALALLGRTWKKVEELALLDERLRPHLAGRDTVRAALDDLALALRDYREGVAFAPGRLEEVEARLALLQRLCRKYGDDEAAVLAHGAECRRQLGLIAGSAEQEGALEEERGTLASRYVEAATALSTRRRKAAAVLEQRVEAELGDLAMEKTRFRVRFAPAETPSDGGDPASWTEGGIESVEFHLSPNPGEELRPLSRVASGGELSRILLGLNSVASAAAAGITLVFDEVDAGIGGRVAEVVGRKLRDLARRHQVLCVTHLPQIASMADNHHVARKRVERGRTTTDVHRLNAAEHVEEVARMLAGETVTDIARQHAREMVKQKPRS
jgi:DNA repair protein RecN (Recombination protein N)